MTEYDSADDCIKSYYAAIEAKRLRGDADQVDALARELFNRQSSVGIWAAADYGVQLYFRRKAQQIITAKRPISSQHSA